MSGPQRAEALYRLAERPKDEAAQTRLAILACHIDLLLDVRARLFERA